MRKINKSKTVLTLAGLAAMACLTVGCNAGNAPAGASVSEMQQTVHAMPLLDQAKITMGGPGPIELKRDKVRQMYKSKGQQAPPEALQIPAPSGPPQGGGPTGA